MLDDLQRGDGAHGNDLKCALQRLHHNIAFKILRHALPYQQQAAHNGKRQQDTGGDAHQVRKKIAHVVFVLPARPRMNATQAAYPLAADTNIIK